MPVKIVQWNSDAQCCAKTSNSAELHLPKTAILAAFCSFLSNENRSTKSKIAHTHMKDCTNASSISCCLKTPVLLMQIGPWALTAAGPRPKSKSATLASTMQLMGKPNSAPAPTPGANNQGSEPLCWCWRLQSSAEIHPPMLTPHTLT